MEKDVLVLLMVAFGLFAIVMFVLFYVYLKKYYNNKHLLNDYQKDIDNNPIEEDEDRHEEVIINVSENNYSNNNDEIKPQNKIESDEDIEMDFVPIKRK